MAKFKEIIRNVFTRNNPTKKNPRSGTNYLDVAPGGEGGPVAPLNVATAYRCLKLISDSIAALPLHKKVRRDGVMAVVPDHLDYLLSVQPNPWMSAFDMWTNVVQQVLLKGNAYIFPVYNGLEIDRLILATPGTVGHNIIDNTYTVMDTLQGLTGTFGEADVIHIKNLSVDGKAGIGVLAHAMRTLGIATAGDIEARKKFSNGGGVKGLLAVKNTGQGGNPFLQDNEEEAFKVAKTLNKQMQVMDVVAMPGEYSFQQFSMSSAEQQFLENRKFTVLEVCRFFGVHPSFVYADTSSNYKSAEMANVAFLVNTLNPLLRKIENELNRKLTGENRSRHISFEFDRTGMYACDLESKVNYMTKLIGLGRTVNEVRLMENLPPVEGGDTPMVSANLRTLEQTIQQNQQSNPNNGNDDKKEPLSE